VTCHCFALVLPLVGGNMIPTNGRLDAARPAETGIHATKWPRSAQEACPAGHQGLTKRLHQLVDGAVQILVGAALLVDLRDRVHHGGVMLASELPPDFG
jgi:hypothetical protein